MSKPEDQITKDKESVAKMAGAKEAMTAALRRIDILESTLKATSSELSALGKLFGDSVNMSIYVSGGWKMTPVKNVVNAAIGNITKVL